MSAVPYDNYHDVLRTVNSKDWLKQWDPHPYIRAEGRWIKTTVDDDVPEHLVEQLADDLRTDGYRVSVMGPTVKATKPDVHWPETDLE